NILLSLAFMRFARPYVETLVQRYGWVAFALLVCALVAVLPIAAKCVDYGAEGWLWGLFGLLPRRYLEGRACGRLPRGGPCSTAQQRGENAGLMRVLACVVAAVVYIWQEQKEFSFPQIHFAVLTLGVGILSLCLCLFRRGPSRIQPPQSMAGVLRFIGRHTLEIYAIQLARSELAVKMFPDLAP